ncbi:ABC transporter permease [Tundrisphaera lichenicola]|uniref:ABC transporter permease n=1 Tax=Tundrisphaera lichenicola TaxID=2029860 RepID=UPI003EB84FD7
MRFSTFIIRNMLNRKARTLLTVLGLSVGIAAVMILTGIAWGFEKSFMAIYQTKGIDLVVVRAGIGNQLSSNLDIGVVDQVRAVEGVADVSPSLMDTVSFEDKNLVSVLANGWEGGSRLFRGIRILEGRAFGQDAGRVVMLGRVLRMNLGKSVGDEVAIAGEPFRVVAIFESDSLFENGGLILPMEELQRMMGREGQATGLVVAAKSSEPEFINDLTRRIEKSIPGVAAVPARDYVQGDLQIRLTKTMSWATTAVALILGSIGLLNTMFMAVFERTGEVGLLRALGWRRKRILALILGEALVLGLLGSVVGTILAYAGVNALVLDPTSQGFVDPNLPPAVIGIGLAMGLGLSLLGGFYPALRAALLDPTEALRHE